MNTTNMNTLRTILDRLMIVVTSIVLFGGGITARAQILFTDGDYDAQTIGSPVGAPWAASGNTATLAAQSPYANVYANNGKGANTPTSGADAYMVRSFTAIPASSTAPLYFNVDFLNTDAPSGIGKYDILISGDGYYTTRSVGFDVRGSTLRASTPAGDPLGEIFLTLAPDTWYNLQVTLDMAAKTYSGVVFSLAGGSTIIPSRPFDNTTYAIDKVYTDTSSYGGAWPSHYTDNWALSTTPFAAVPEPSTIALGILGLGSLLLLRRRN